MSESQIPIGARRICFECILEPHLRSKIEQNGCNEACFYCEQVGASIPVSEIAKKIDEILSTLYDAQQMPSEEDVKSGKPVAQVISDLLVAAICIAEDIRQVLSEHWASESVFGPENNPFHPKRPYVSKRSVLDFEYDGNWLRFERSLKSEARYFNSTAESFMASVFEGIEERQTIKGHPVIAEAGPGTNFERLYRARIFQKERDFRDALLQSDVELGPPRKFPASASRMNAAGIPVFYGATTSAVALAEVRPPVGSRVLVGCFQVIQPLKLLDLLALTELADKDGSVFDETHLEDLKRSAFLRSLTLRLSKPVMPSDEPFEYLPTQAVADFLSREEWPGLDGVIYPSVQAGGVHRLEHSSYGFFERTSKYACNVALFHKAARIEPLAGGAKLSVWSDHLFLATEESLEVGPNPEYTVWLPQPEILESPLESNSTLKVESVEAHYVSGVKVDTQPIKISRFVKPDEFLE